MYDNINMVYKSSSEVSNMKRKIYQQLLDWKNNSQGKSALLIEGARRVGKSYIVEEFAKKEYETYLLIDFNISPLEIKALFDNYLQDLDTFFLFLSTFYGKKLYPRKSLIIFDEVQMFPKARSAIKYLVQDGRYDYIETGSLLSIKENVKDILIPSEEIHLKMHPMDFEEFLWAMGNEVLFDFLRDCFTKHKPLGQTMHRKAMDLFRQYLLVGGMPQVVNEYIKTKDFSKAIEAQKLILNLYRADISKHAKTDKRKCERILDVLPSQLSKHKKRFNLSAIKKGARYRDYETAFYWLDDAMILNTAYNATMPSAALKLNLEASSFKCYMLDTGLLFALTLEMDTKLQADLYQKILFGKLNLNEGMFLENIVAQILVANNHPLYFYSKSSNKAEDRMEIDFLISKNEVTSKHNICPIEVKSSPRYTLSSLNKFQIKFKNELSTPYVIHPSDLKEENGIVYLPFYMTPLL